jgi:hypothetical protein
MFGAEGDVERGEGKVTIIGSLPFYFSLLISLHPNIG